MSALRAVFCLVSLLLVSLVHSSAAHAQRAIQSEAPNWCVFAKQDLRTRSGAGVTCDANTPRCIKMNNYTCTKNSHDKAYEGQVMTPDGKPVTDIAHHALYVDPKWSVIEGIKFLSRYYNQLGLHSATAIAETWAPWCDTDGSARIHMGWGRTCTDYPGPAPASFTGPRCEKPAGGIPLKGQCGPCNCPNDMAAFYAKGSGKSVTDDLELFDKNGAPTAVMKAVLPHVVTEELGYVPQPELIDSAIEAYKP